MVVRFHWGRDDISLGRGLGFFQQGLGFTGTGVRFHWEVMFHWGEG